MHALCTTCDVFPSLIKTLIQIWTCVQMHCRRRRHRHLLRLRRWQVARQGKCRHDSNPKSTNPLFFDTAIDARRNRLTIHWIGQNRSVCTGTLVQRVGGPRYIGRIRLHGRTPKFYIFLFYLWKRQIGSLWGVHLVFGCRSMLRY